MNLVQRLETETSHSYFNYMDSLCKKVTKKTIHHGAVSKFGQGIRLKLLLIEVSFDKPSQVGITALTEIYEDKHVELEKRMEYRSSKIK